MSSPTIPPEAHIAAIAPFSLSWDQDAVKAAVTKEARQKFRDEAMAWQRTSQLGDWAAFRSVIDQSVTKRGRPKDPNRIVEIHAIAGAIGEQLTLCWAGEQDAQRILQTATLGDEHRRLVLRAVSESAGYFLLGAAHSMGNLVVRVALLDSSAGTETRRKLRRADLAVGSEDHGAWLSLSKASEILKEASTASSNVYLGRCAAAIETLYTNPRFQDLDDRRGMDFHRLRPQSVQHSSSRGGIVKTSATASTMSMGAAHIDPDADGLKVHGILVRAMSPVLAATRILKREIPKSIRSSGYLYNEPFAVTIKVSRPGR